MAPKFMQPRLLSLILVMTSLLGALWPASPSWAATSASRVPSPTILVLGDSVSAGYGIESQQSWVSLLQAKLKSQGYGYRVINASVSGETTTGGLARLPRALELHRPKIVIIELGGNDGLRGLPLATSRGNLQKMIEQSRAAGAQVLLLGMKIPPNYGPRYAQGFEDVFRELASRYQLAFEPFFLERIALEPGMMQEDGLHPTAKAQPIMLDTVWPVLQPLLRAKSTRP
jgi:acyl-CoA thioesterase-1